jgi:hypothetical protein
MHPPHGRKSNAEDFEQLCSRLRGLAIATIARGVDGQVGPRGDVVAQEGRWCSRCWAAREDRDSSCSAASPSMINERPARLSMRTR